MRKRPARTNASPSQGRGVYQFNPRRTTPESWPFWGGSRPPLKLFDLGVIELDRGRAAEDRNRDLEAGALLVDVLDGAVEGGKGTVRHLDLLTDLEADGGLGPFDALLDLLQDAARLGIGDRHRLAA